MQGVESLFWRIFLMGIDDVYLLVTGVISIGLIGMGTYCELNILRKKTVKWKN